MPNDSLVDIDSSKRNRKDKTKTTTLIRRVSGDVDGLVKELRSVLQLPHRLPYSNADPIKVRTGPSIEIQGNRVRDVKQWLTGLGF